MATALEEVFELSDLVEKTLYDPKLTYLFNRYLNSVEQYRTFVSDSDLHIAGFALDDAINDLFRLLLVIDPTFERNDADFLNRGYVREYMGGWEY